MLSLLHTSVGVMSQFVEDGVVGDFAGEADLQSLVGRLVWRLVHVNEACAVRLGSGPHQKFLQSRTL